MAEKIKSVFGPYADKMQVLIDKTKESFNTPWFPKYFDWGTTTVSLDYKTVIGRSRVEAAASVVDRESPSPQRTRSTIDKLSGEVPAIKQKFKMTESDYRNYKILQSIPMSDSARQKAVLDLMYKDLSKAANAPLRRLDIMTAQALSLGKVQVNKTNNPDGVVFDDIDLLMSDDNRKGVAVVWSSSTTAKPITDIFNKVENARARGIIFEKMLMDRTAFLKLSKATETKEMINGLLGVNRDILPTLKNVNTLLSEYGLPIIELIELTVGIEKDGKISTISPWNSTSVTFVPSGKLGLIHNAFAMEQMEPVPSISYAVNNNVLISKWSENDPWAEWTQSELNAFPGVEAIDSMYIMDIETVEA